MHDISIDHNKGLCIMNYVRCSERV